MSNIEEKYFKKTEKEIKSYELLKSVFSKIYSIETDLRNSRKSTFDDISKIQDDNIPLNNIYTEFTNKLKSLEDERNEQILKIKSKIIPFLDYITKKAKTEKNQINLYKNTVTDTQKKEYELEKAKKSGDALKESVLNNDIARNKDEINRRGESMPVHLIQFEKKRIIDHKAVFLYYVHKEIAYHTKAVEILTDLYKKIKFIEPKQDLLKFADKMKIHNINLDDYGYVEKPKINLKQSEVKIDNLGESTITQKEETNQNNKNEKKGMIQSVYKDDLEDIIN
jgi:hypothetical protein